MRALLFSKHGGRLSLRANFSWTLAGNVVYNGCQWGLVIVLAKLGSPELVGQYAIALAVATPVYMFTNLGVSVVLITDVQDRRAFGEYLGHRLVFSSLGLLFIVGIVAVGGYQKDLFGIVALVGLAKFAESISDISYGLMQKQERLDVMARSLVLRGVLSLVAMTVAFYISRSLAVALAAQVVVWSGVLWLHDLPNARRWQAARPRFGPRMLARLSWLALPLGIVAGLGSLDAQVPRYTLEHFWGQRELGIYSAIASLGVVVSLIIVALSRSALPRLSRLYAQGAFRAFLRLLVRLIAIGAGVGLLGFVGAALVGAPFLRLVYTEEYAAYKDVLMVVMGSMGLVAAFTFLGTAVTATQQFTVQVLIHLTKVAAIAGACFLLVAPWGALGAAWAVLIGSAVSAAAFCLVLWRSMRRATRSVGEAGGISS